jgi:hypothetical protein
MALSGHVGSTVRRCFGFKADLSPSPGRQKSRNELRKYSLGVGAVIGT